MTVLVEDDGEAPAFSTPAVMSVVENEPAGSVVGQVVVSDPDLGDHLDVVLHAPTQSFIFGPPACVGHVSLMSGEIPACVGHVSVMSGEIPACVGHVSVQSGERHMYRRRKCFVRGNTTCVSGVSVQSGEKSHVSTT